MNELLNKTFLGNSLLAWLTCIGIFVVSLLFIIIFKRVIITRLKRWSLNTVSTVDDFLIGTVEKSVIPLLYVAAVYFAMHALTLPRQPAG